MAFGRAVKPFMAEISFKKDTNFASLVAMGIGNFAKIASLRIGCSLK